MLGVRREMIGYFASETRSVCVIENWSDLLS